jgi:flagellin
MSALNNLMAQRLIGEHTRNIGAIMEKLATGERINRAKDDPSGVMVSARLDAEMMQIRGELESNDALVHKLAVTDGYYSVLADMAIDLEATVRAAGAGNTLSEAEREALQIEADSIIKGMAHIYETAVFKGEKLLGSGIDISSGGSYHRMELAKFEDWGRTRIYTRPQPDPVDPPRPDPSTDPVEPGERMEITPPEDPFASITDILTGGRLNLIDGDLGAAMQVATAAREGIDRTWGQIGSQMRSAESRQSTLAVMLEGNRAASGALTDTDYASETSALVREQVLQQASIFVLQRSMDAHKRTLGLLMAN